MIIVQVGTIQFVSDRSRDWILTRLEGWDDLPDAKNSQDSWPHSHGNAATSNTWYDGRSITVEGAYVPSDGSSVDRMIRQMRGMGGSMVNVGVCRDGEWLWTRAEIRGITSTLGVVNKYATFQISLLAPNTALYSAAQSQTVSYTSTANIGIKSPLTSPLEDGGGGVSFGAVNVTGSGVFATSVKATITGPFTNGVRLSWQSSGSVLYWEHSLDEGESIVFDFNDERVLWGDLQSDVSRYLTEIQWGHPTGDDLLQFEPEGIPSDGNPLMTVEWREAWL